MDRCSVCHRAFEEDDLQVMARNANVWMLVVKCRDCHARLFVAALVGDGDADAANRALRQIMQENRDEFVVGAEAEIEPEPEPVTEEDVQEMHEFLQSFGGDFRKLFSSD